jgi:hypothetical protein
MKSSKFLYTLLLSVLLYPCTDIQAQSLGGTVATTSKNKSGSETKEIRARFGGAAKDRRLEIAIAQSGLSIEGYNGDELIVVADGVSAVPERAKGLKPISPAGVDNTGIGLEIINEGSTIKLRKISNQEINYKIKVPRSIALNVEEVNFFGGGSIQISDLEGDLEVKARNSDIKVNNFSGALVAQNTSGSIEVSFNRINPDKPSSIINVSGEVDISLPADTKALLKMKAITGEVYSDFDIKFPETSTDKTGLARVGGNKSMTGSINGGGVEMRIEAISGNIYLRKK